MFAGRPRWGGGGDLNRKSILVRPSKWAVMPQVGHTRGWPAGGDARAEPPPPLRLRYLLPRMKTLVTFRLGFISHIGRRFETLGCSPIDKNTPYLV